MHINHSCVFKTVSDERIRDYLMAHGVLPGSPLCVIAKIPFNGAITCDCRHTRLAIRAEDAACIVVDA